MKHDTSTTARRTCQQEVIKEIIEKVHSEYNTNDIQLLTMIDPIISNHEFKTINKVMENERFSTLVKLARVLDDENMSKAIQSLGYTLK